MPDVSFVWIVLIAWGKKDTDVQNAAPKPSIVIGFITLKLLVFHDGIK